MIPMILMAIEDDADRAFMINLYEQCHKAMYRQAYDILRDHGVELSCALKLDAVVTQNIDGLHQLAGSKNVYELHGSIHRNHCMRCNRFFDAEYVKNHSGIPYCPCGGMIKADMLIVGGTSLQVYPAAGLINYYSGNKLVLINRTVTPYDSYANLVINDSIGKVLSAAVE